MTGPNSKFLSSCANSLLPKPNDAEKKSKRFFEICTNYKEEWAEDSDESDRYEEDEDADLPVAGGLDFGPLGMRVGREPKPGEKSKPEQVFAEPDYKVMGGGCWKLLSSLKSRTRFINSEIRKEGT